MSCRVRTWFSFFLVSKLAMGSGYGHCGLTARHFLLFGGPFWLDETDSVVVAGRAWPQLWDSLAYDTFPLAHVVLFKLWLGLFGFLSPEIALRLLGFLVGCGVALTFAVFCRRFAPASVPLFFVFFNFNPAVVRYLESARPYGLSTLFFLLLAYNALSALESGRRRAVWGAILAAFGAVHCHYFNALGVVAVGAALLWVGRAPDLTVRRTVRQMAFGIAVALVSGLIYLPVLQRAATWLPWTRLPERDAHGLFFALNWLLNSMSSGPAYLWIFSVAFAVVLLLGRADSPADKKRITFCLWCGGCASALLLSAMLVGRTNASPWYFIPTLGLTAMCLEPAWGRMVKLSPLVQPVLRFGVLALGLFLVLDSLSSLQQPMATIDRAAQLVARRATERDIVIVTPWPSGVTFNFYYDGKAPFTTVPPLADYSIVRFDLAGQAVAQTQPLAPLLGRLGATLRSGNRVFVVGQLEKQLPVGIRATHSGFNSQVLKTARLQWEAQVTAYLKRHARKRQELRSESVCFSSECPSVSVLSGWQ